MKLIVGLGNPSEKYIYTRHNIGFIILDMLADKLGVQFKKEDKFKSLTALIKVEPSTEGSTLLVKPQTYMNLSGDSVRLVSDFYKIEPKNILIIHDDIDFEVGQIKKQFGKSSAGHNGVQSVIDCLNTNEFYRLRVGIGNPSIDSTSSLQARSGLQVASEDFVLRNIPKEDLEKIVNQIDLKVLGF